MPSSYPFPGASPNCCENGNAAITFKAAEGHSDTEGFAAWTIPFHIGEICHTEIFYCPFCGRRISESWSDEQEDDKA